MGKHIPTVSIGFAGAGWFGQVVRSAAVLLEDVVTIGVECERKVLCPNHFDHSHCESMADPCDD